MPRVQLVAARTPWTVPAAWAVVVMLIAHALTAALPAVTGAPGGLVSGASISGAVAILAILLARVLVAGGRAAGLAPAHRLTHAAQTRASMVVPRHRDPDAAGRARPRAPSPDTPAA